MKPDSSNDVDRVHGHIDQRGPQDTDDKGTRHNLSFPQKIHLQCTKVSRCQEDPPKRDGGIERPWQHGRTQAKSMQQKRNLYAYNIQVKTLRTQAHASQGRSAGGTGRTPPMVRRNAATIIASCIEAMSVLL